MEGLTIDQAGRAIGPDSLPDGEYAIVEIMGHCTMIGRVAEVQRFGTAMLQVEPLFDGRLLEPVLQGGQSIYRFTPCTKATAFEKHPRCEWSLPSAVRARLAPPSLPGFERPLDEDRIAAQFDDEAHERAEDEDDDDEDDRPF